MRFYLTDVFAEEPFSGNQLATVLDAGALGAPRMQQIAREFHFSETTFVLSKVPRDGGYDVRIFTPNAEVPFAGHPTLGTAHVLRRHLLRQPVEELILNLGIGPVRVTFPGRGEVLWMRQAAPEFGARHPPSRIEALFGIGAGEVDGRWPIEEVSTGLPHLIVPLRSLSALRRVRIRSELYAELVGDRRPLVLLAFCLQGYDDRQDLGVRVFPLPYGIAEDPATGSGNGCLAAYLVRHRVFGSPEIDCCAGQGYEIDRPSTLYLRAAEDGDTARVEVGGKVRDVADGELRSEEP